MKERERERERDFIFNKVDTDVHGHYWDLNPRHSDKWAPSDTQGDLQAPFAPKRMGLHPPSLLPEKRLDHVLSTLSQVEMGPSLLRVNPSYLESSH